MLDMPTIQSIRARRAKGETLSEIATHEKVSVPTSMSSYNEKH